MNILQEIHWASRRSELRFHLFGDLLECCTVLFPIDPVRPLLVGEVVVLAASVGVLEPQNASGMLLDSCW